MRYIIVLKRLFIISVLLSLALARAGAQYDASFAQYWDLEPYYNPAAAGKQAKLNVAGAYAMSLTGFENSPKTMYVGADMPVYFLRNYHGVGVSLLNDQIDLFTHQRIAL